MNYYGSEEKLEWDNNESILSQISDNINDASFRLNSTGLGDLNTWVKPRHVLSIGEGKFRFIDDLSFSNKKK